MRIILACIFTNVGHFFIFGLIYVAKIAKKLPKNEKNAKFLAFRLVNVVFFIYLCSAFMSVLRLAVWSIGVYYLLLYSY